MTKLTVKQEAFAKAYIETGNASEAYRRSYSAGKMKDEAVHVKASELLKHGKVAVRIAELQAGHQKRHELTVDRVVAEYARIAFADIRQVVKWGEAVAVTDAATGEMTITNGVAIVNSADLDDASAALIAEVSQTKDGNLKVKLHDKLRALDKIGQHLGMFPQTVNVNADHQHHHTVEPLSESAHWLERLLGAGSDSAPQKLVSH